MIAAAWDYHLKDLPCVHEGLAGTPSPVYSDVVVVHSEELYQTRKPPRFQMSGKGHIADPNFRFCTNHQPITPTSLSQKFNISSLDREESFPSIPSNHNFTTWERSLSVGCQLQDRGRGGSD